MAGFKPQANLPFVAAYVAQEKGYFAEQGLDVEIRHAPRGGHLQLLLSGDVDFTTAARHVGAEAPGGAGCPHRGRRALRPERPAGVHGPEGLRYRNDRGTGRARTSATRSPCLPTIWRWLKTNGVDRSKITEVNAGFRSTGPDRGQGRRAGRVQGQRA